MTKTRVHKRPMATMAMVAFLVLSGCSSIAPFSQVAYEKATSLKAESLILMDQASDPFVDHQKDVDVLKLNLEKAYEYAKGRPHNEDTVKQWEIIKDPQRNSLGGFLKRWETSSTLSKGFIMEAKILVGEGFDSVIGLESGKLKPTDVRQQ